MRKTQEKFLGLSVVYDILNKMIYTKNDFLKAYTRIK